MRSKSNKTTALRSLMLAALSLAGYPAFAQSGVAGQIQYAQ